MKRDGNDGKAAQEGLYPIRTVSELTGVHPVTLRAWERRYHLIVPTRTAKGHRLYTEADIERIREVVRHLGEGVSVGQVRRLLDDQPENARPGAGTAPARDPWRQYVECMLEAVRAFDESALDGIYNDALSLYPIELISARLTTPVMETLGESWRGEETGIAREHFFSHFLRNKLGARLHHLNHRSSGPRVLGACLEGEFHELGLLQFSLAAATHGYRVVALGGNVPVSEIASAAQTARCAVIVLSTSSNYRRTVLQTRVAKLTRLTDLPVLVGGAAAARWPDIVAGAGANAVGIDFRAALASLGQAVGQR
ncbi:MAG: MerR family transcriptional regulator [Proteobacteria bacterium]|nr:MAG: MerR family transcriptional regulator [Pseudomonadota bacterium]